MNLIISGATSPLALEIITWAYGKGYNVYTFSRRLSGELTELIDKQIIRKAFIADFSEDKQILDSVQKLSNCINKIDILINNSCGWIADGIRNTSLDDIKYQINSSITGNIIFVKNTIPLLQNSNKPRIINICSTVGTGYRFSPNTLYTVLKGALEAFGRSLRNDLNKDKILITNLHLGQFNDNSEVFSQKMPLSDIVKTFELIINLSNMTSLDNLCLTPSELYY